MFGIVYKKIIMLCVLIFDKHNLDCCTQIMLSSVNFNSGVQIPARFGGAGPAHNDALRGGGLPVSGPVGEEIQTELNVNITNVCDFFLNKNVWDVSSYKAVSLERLFSLQRLLSLLRLLSLQRLFSLQRLLSLQRLFNLCIELSN
jgi:hypothetical protein